MPMHQRHPERQAQRNRNDDRDSASAPEAVQASSERTAYLQSVQRKAAGPLPSAPSVTDLLAQGPGRPQSPSEQAFGGSPGPGPGKVQRKGDGQPMDAGHMEQIAHQGVDGPGQKLPHLDKIQPLFGHHDVSGIDAHVGGTAGKASEALAAQGYATGSKVAFKKDPDLHLAAHEAAHVVQQRAGVHLRGETPQSGDPLEDHADAVADAVTGGQSATGLLDAITGQPQEAATAAATTVPADDMAGGIASVAASTTAPTGEIASADPQALAPAEQTPAEDHAAPEVKPTDPTLAYGATGPKVKKLQQELNARGVEPPLKVDGVFGGKTKAAVQNFQEHGGLAVSGVVDAETWGALGLAAATPDFDATDEAEGENVKEKMDRANTGPYGLDVGIHYSYNYEYECKKAGQPGLWKDEYRLGHADPTYFDQQGFMDWKLKPGMSASAAIKSWLRGLTVAECNSSVVAMEIDSLRGSIGDQKFDSMFGSTDVEVPAEQLLRVKPGTEGTPVGQFMKTPDLTKLKMEKDQKGEKLSDEEFDSAIHPGEWYYFYNHPKYLLKHPGGAWQGENSIYMGKKDGVRSWSGLGASNVTEGGMYDEMVSAYNGDRDKEDERAMREQGMKNADGTYADPKYDPKSGEFADTVDQGAILGDPAYVLGGVTRKGGFDFEAGQALDSAKVKALRDKDQGAGTP